MTEKTRGGITKRYDASAVEPTRVTSKALNKQLLELTSAKLIVTDFVTSAITIADANDFPGDPGIHAMMRFAAAYH